MTTPTSLSPASVPLVPLHLSHSVLPPFLPPSFLPLLFLLVPPQNPDDLNPVGLITVAEDYAFSTISCPTDTYLTDCFSVLPSNSTDIVLSFLQLFPFAYASRLLPLYFTFLRMIPRCESTIQSYLFTFCCSKSLISRWFHPTVPHSALIIMNPIPVRHIPGLSMEQSTTDCGILSLQEQHAPQNRVFPFSFPAVPHTFPPPLPFLLLPFPFTHLPSLPQSISPSIPSFRTHSLLIVVCFVFISSACRIKFTLYFPITR